MENYHKTRTVERPSVCPFSGLPPDTPEVRVRDGSKIRHPLRYALSRMEGGAGPREAGAGPREGGAGPREAVEGPREGGAGPREAVAGPREAVEGPREGPREGGAGPREAGAGPREAVEGPREGVEGRPLCRQMVLTARGGGVSKAVTCAEVVKRRVPGLHQTTRLQFCTVDEVWDPLEAGAGLDSLTVSRSVPSIWILLSRDTPDQSRPGYQEPGRHDGLWAHREDGGGRAGPTPGRKRKKGGARGQGQGQGQSGRSTEPAKGHT